MTRIYNGLGEHVATRPDIDTVRALNGYLSTESAEAAVRRLLTHVGEDPDRQGLTDTPARVVRALTELTAGYTVDVGALLDTTFDVGGDHDEMVMVKAIPFSSLCEHHLLPFTGHATVAYVPRDNVVVGLSKISRLVVAFAQRLQVQERMTTQIADALVEHLDPLGVAVLVEGTHACMSMRGIGVTAPMVTSCTRGLFRTAPEARAEFMALAV